LQHGSSVLQHANCFKQFLAAQDSAEGWGHPTLLESCEATPQTGRNINPVLLINPTLLINHTLLQCAHPDTLHLDVCQTAASNHLLYCPFNAAEISNATISQGCIGQQTMMTCKCSSGQLYAE